MNTAHSAFGFSHKSGILMPISSLPSRYGIGSLGKCAYDFVDFLARCSQTVWQVLPINQTSYGDSPYQSPASASGNPYFIDLDILVDKALLSEDELEYELYDGGRVDYGRLFSRRYNILMLAHSRFRPGDGYRRFCMDNASWLDNYALFMALKCHYSHAPWTEWRQEHKNFESAKACASQFTDQIHFWRWIQYEFFSEWNQLHEYARSKGIYIIGDMPIYVAHDSMDVWCAPEQFLLDESHNPTLVAGCPPDDYSEDGQKWGNPLYNWEKMKEEGYAWWIDRMGLAFNRYDLVRIDHFRGFAGYFAIPADDENAKRGEWHKGPSEELFDAISLAYPEGRIIAEDLGFITDDVRALLAHTGFPGMKVLQFAFYSDDSEYLPRCFESDNCIVYTSTHDSDTAMSWFETLSGEALERFKREYRVRGKRSGAAVLTDIALGSPANLAVIPIQDYLELTNEEGRMNIPSTPYGNWTWRLDSKYNTSALRNRILTFTKKHDRQRVFDN